MKWLNFISFIRFYVYFCCISISQVSLLEFPPEKLSFAVYDPWKAEINSGIIFHFKTYKTEALLVFQDDGLMERWIKVKISEGVLKVFLNQKKHLQSITFDHYVSNLNWHQVRLQWRKYSLDITLNSEQKRIQINEIPLLKTELYIGGLAHSAAMSLSFARFEGCIASIKYLQDGIGQFEPNLISSTNVRPGCSDACTNAKFAKCNNAGRCVDRIFSAHCDCLGTGYEDYDCSKESLVAWTNGSGYVIYDVARNPRSSLSNFIVFRFKTPEPNAIILQTSMAKDFLSIGLEDGNVKVAVSLGAGTLEVLAGNSYLNDNKWHSVKLSRVGREITLIVDDRYRAHDYTAGNFHRLDHGGESVIYIAGAPAHKKLPWRNFKGYLQQFIFDDLSILDKTFYTFDNRFIAVGHMNIVF